MFSWFTKNTKAVVLVVLAGLAAVAGVVRGLAPEHTVADKAATATERIAPVVIDIVEQLPTVDGRADGGR